VEDSFPAKEHANPHVTTGTRVMPKIPYFLDTIESISEQTQRQTQVQKDASMEDTVLAQLSGAKAGVDDVLAGFQLISKVGHRDAER